MADKKVTITVVADVEDGEVQNLDQLIEDIKSEAIGLDVEVEDGDIDTAKAKEEELNTTAQVDIKVNDTDVQTAMSNIQSGLNDVKAGFGEIATGMTDALESSGKQELNFAFLKNSIGDADIAKQKMQDINKIVQDMPGDDTALQGLLSSASAKNAKLTTAELQKMGNAATDYFTAMSYYGKSSIEAQQDMTNYILAGNTAELERSPILQGHIDKLKEANTIQERSKVLQEALNEEGWGGLSQDPDLYANKLATFEGMLERGKTQLGGFFQEGAKAGMDFLMNLDDMTGGISTLGLSFATEFGPGLFQGAQGLISMGSGLTTMSAKFGGVMPMISHFAGEIPLIGGALSSLSLGPVALAIAAIVALGVAIFEIGKSFGWWTDVSTMFEAIGAGAQRMWDAFMNNEGVIMIIEQIKDAFSNLMSFLGQIGGIIGEALGFDQMGGEFDIVSAAINFLGQVGSYVLPAISGLIHYFKEACAALAPVVIWVLQNIIIPHFQRIYTVAVTVWPYVSAIISGAIGVIRGVISGAMAVWTGLQSAWRTLQSTASSVFSAIDGIISGAGGVWNSFKSTVMGVIQPIIDKINDLKNAASGVGDFLHGIGFGGIETSNIITGASGIGSTTVSNGNTIIFNMYGDIKDEKTLDDTIEAINSRLQFESLANGMIDNGRGTV